MNLRECVERGLLDVGDGHMEHPSQYITSTWMFCVLNAVMTVSNGGFQDIIGTAIGHSCTMGMSLIAIELCCSCCAVIRIILGTSTAELCDCSDITTLTKLEQCSKEVLE